MVSVYGHLVLWLHSSLWWNPVEERVCSSHASNEAEEQEGVSGPISLFYFAFCYCNGHQDQKQVGKEKVYFILHAAMPFYCLPKGDPTSIPGGIFSEVSLPLNRAKVRPMSSSCEPLETIQDTND